jgi:hypothetical protein
MYRTRLSEHGFALCRCAGQIGFHNHVTLDRGYSFCGADKTDNVPCWTGQTRGFSRDARRIGAKCSSKNAPHHLRFGGLRQQLRLGGGGLSNLPAVLAKIAAGQPSAITVSKGAAMNCWAPYAGKIPLIVQCGYFTADDRVIEYVTDSEECVRLADRKDPLRSRGRRPQTHLQQFEKLAC